MMNGEGLLRRLEPALAALWRRRDAVAAGLAAAWLAGALAVKPGVAATVSAAISGAALVLLLARLARAEAAVRSLAGRDASVGLADAIAAAEHRLSAVGQRSAQTHAVTGVPTREPLAERIAADIAEGAGERLLGAVRLTDYDRLAAFDLDAANAVLTQFARRLTDAAKADIILGQIDRDTFALWFQPDGKGRVAAAEFQALVYVCRQELEAPGGPVAPRVEAAAVRYPADGDDAAHLFVRATAALKGAEAGPTPIAAPEPTDAARSRFRLEQDLGRAIDDGQLKMVFQPVVDTARGRLLGAEALLRWDHPELGPISPARFIPVVEASGLADRFGLFVLNSACREAKAWRDEGYEGLKVAVNLSARQLGDPDLKAKIERTLERHRLDPAALELELTETAAMTEAERTFELFGALQKTGVSLAIDDFGSGYSSLSYLKNLPFNKLKIDREFVTDIDRRRDSRAICRALIELGRGLDLTILAEGVETAAEVDTLRALGCSVFQGYFFSKPLSGPDFRRLAADPAWQASPPSTGTPAAPEVQVR